MRIFILAVACSLFLLAGCNSPRADNSFSFRPDTSKIYRVVKTKDETQSWQYQDKPHQNTNHIEKAFQLKVESIPDDSSYVLKLTFERFQIQRLQTNTELPVPTASELEQEPLKLWDYLFHFAKGQSVYVTIDNHGTVKNVQGVAAVIDTITKLSGKERSIVRAYLRDEISKEALRDELTELFCFIPARPKQTAQSWVTDVVFITKAPVQWSNMYVLQALQHDTARMSVPTVVSARQGEQGRVYMKGKLAGNIIAGYSSGIPFSYNLTGEMVTTTDVNTITNTTSIKWVIGE